MREPDQAISPTVVEGEVERALIGRILIGHKGTPIPPPDLPPSRFGIERHRVIWGAILDQHRKGLPTDTVSVVSALKARGLLDEVGGAKMVSAFENAAGTFESVPHYCALLEQAAARRAFGPLGRQIAELSTWDPSSRSEVSVASRYRSLVRRGEALSRLTADRNGHAQTLSTETPYRILTTPVEPIPWVYEGWLARQDVVILAGESGLGKSLLAMDLMVSLMTGRPFLGSIVNKAGRQRVLYIDEENNPRLIRYRLHRLIDGLDLGLGDIDPAQTSGEYAMENAVRVDDFDSLARIQRTVDAFGPDWIVFDSMIRFHQKEENRSEQMAMVGGAMKALARSCGGGAVIIHHLGKGGGKDKPQSMKARIRGSSDIPAIGDMIWALSRPTPEDDELRFSSHKSRWGQEPAPLSVRIEDVHLGHGVRLTGSEPERDALATIVEALKEAEHDGLSRQGMLSLLQDTGFEPKPADRAVSRVLKKLRGDGTAVQKQTGREMRYWLGAFAPPGSE